MYVYDVETGEHRDVSPATARELMEAGTHAMNPNAMDGPAGEVARRHEGEMKQRAYAEAQMRAMMERQAFESSLTPDERARIRRFERMGNDAARFAGGGRRNVSRG